MTRKEIWEDVVDQFAERRDDYCGRGMYGKSVTAAVVESMDAAFILAQHLGAALADTPHNPITLSFDNMGNEYVVYPMAREFLSEAGGP